MKTVSTSKPTARKFNVPFENLFLPAFSVSVALVVLSLVLMGIKGLNYGIDFSGGTEVQVQFKNAKELSDLRKFVEGTSITKPIVQSFEEGNEYLFRFQNPIAGSDKESALTLNDQIKQLSDGLATQFAADEPVVRRVDSVGPAIGEELKRSGLLASFYSLILILIYIALRFDFKYAPGAVIALFHDSILVLGFMTLLGKEVNVQTVAAILTIIGYSINDTIVCFDRIRENSAVQRSHSFLQTVKLSLNETLSRTVLTSLTTFFAILAVFVFSTGSLADFALALMVGIAVGTYSSLFVAAPILVFMDKLMGKPSLVTQTAK